MQAAACPHCGHPLPDSTSADTVDDETLFESFVGAKWQGRYRERIMAFARQAHSPVSWNWAAFFVPGWFLYRKLYDYWIGFLLLFFLLWVAQGVAALAEMTTLVMVASACTFLGVPILQGMFGDYLLYRRARKVVTHARSRITDARDLRSAVLQRGGTSLTVPLLMLVPLGVIWIGILAAVAIPQFAATKELAYQIGMESDLRNLIAAQRTFLLTNERYAENVEELSEIFQPLPGVTITIEATDYGWIGTAIHRSTATRCQVYVGSRSDVEVEAFVTAEAVPACVRAPQI
ncbi:MAG: DUF2628 domain-containing protein [Gemmatimonadales bacterium]|nr:DUF2628 domain-containing protein [Gemmatimonadales bacterium]